MCVSRFVDGQVFEQKVNHSAYVILPDCCSAQLATRLKYDLRVLGERDILPDTHFILFLFYCFGIFVIMVYFGGVDLLLSKSILAFLCMCHYVGITSQTNNVHTYLFLTRVPEGNCILLKNPTLQNNGHIKPCLFSRTTIGQKTGPFFIGVFRKNSNKEKTNCFLSDIHPHTPTHK